MDPIPDNLFFDSRGLIPAIIQDEVSGKVLMMAYMNREALGKTLKTGFTHFYSRSREQLWPKGETSGHTQRVKEIRYDCDGDTLLLLVEQKGVACHTGAYSCFHHPLFGEGTWGIIDSLFSLIEERKREPLETSYTCRLFEKGREEILKKVGEESTEVLLAGMKGERGEIIYELADLTYHLLVFLVEAGLSPHDVRQELRKRFQSEPSTATDGAGG